MTPKTKADQFSGGTGYATDGVAAPVLHRRGSLVEPQFGLALRSVGSVAVKASVGEKRQHITTKVNRLLGAREASHWPRMNETAIPATTRPYPEADGGCKPRMFEAAGT